MNYCKHCLKARGERFLFLEDKIIEFNHIITLLSQMVITPHVENMAEATATQAIRVRDISMVEKYNLKIQSLYEEIDHLFEEIDRLKKLKNVK